MADEHTAKAKETLRRGDYYNWVETFYEDDGTTPLAGLDLMDPAWEFLMQVRATEDDATVMATWTITPLTANSLRRELPDAEAATLVPGEAVQDLQGIGPDGHRRTFIAWKLKIEPDVSRP